MKVTFLSLLMLLAGSLLVPAQDTVSKDLKGAGSDTKNAAKKGAVATKNGAKKGATATAHGVKKGTHKAASATEKGASKVKQKTTDTGTH
jgi:hypothetical protein